MSRPETTPRRIQRRRTKGWRMPPNTVYVGRPTIWGNPFPGTPKGLDAYRGLVIGIVSPEMYDLGDLEAWRARMRPCGHPLDWARSTLRGKDLCCWCRLCDAHRDGKPLGVVCPNCTPCHADRLLQLANP